MILKNLSGELSFEIDSKLVKRITTIKDEAEIDTNIVEIDLIELTKLPMKESASILPIIAKIGAQLGEVKEFGAERKTLNITLKPDVIIEDWNGEWNKENENPPENS